MDKENFKELVSKKLYLVESEGLKELLIWEPERLVIWVKELDKYPTEEIYDGIKRWGNESNIEINGVSLIKEIHLLNKKIEQEKNFQKVMNEMDNGRKRDIFKAMPKASGIIYRMFRNWILLHKDFDKTELIPLIQNSTNATSAYLDYAIECMTKENIKLTEVEAKEFKEKISSEIRSRLRIDELIKKTLIDVASKQEVKTGQKPKMNIKESKETWADILIDFEEQFQSRPSSLVYKQIGHELTKFVYKNLRNCSVEDFVDIGYCYHLLTHPTFKNAVGAMLSTLKPEVRKEIAKIKREDEVGISDHFWKFQKQIRQEDEKAALSKEEPIKPKVKKASFKENKFERMFDYLSEETNG